MVISEFSSVVFDRENYKYDEEIDYRQMFSRKDKIRLCVGVDTRAGEKLSDINCYMTSDDSTPPTVQREEYGNSFIVFSLNAGVGNIDYGTYKVNVGNLFTLKGYSAEFDIVSEDCLQDTMVLDYSDTRNKFDTVFRDKSNNPLFYTFRFLGSILDRSTDFGIEGAIFNDQSMQSKTLSGFIKDTYTLVVGDNNGVPNGFGRKVRNALSCNICYLNKFQASITEATSLSREDIGDSYPFFRFTAEINYDKSALESYNLKNFRYLCNNIKTKLFLTATGKVLTTNRRF